jgi:hypothetical protein
VTLPAPGRAAPSPSAAAITVVQTLGLLDSPFAELSEGISNGRYALWLGSGISRDAVDDLRVLVKKVLEYLRDNADFSVSDCPYAKALERTLVLAQLSDLEKAAFDPKAGFADWGAVTDAIVTRLTSKYSRLLDIRLAGRAADHLLWEVIDVPAVYAADGLEPQCEHICVALLVIEGVVRDILSANWDGLIEAAVAELTGGAPQVLSVCVVATDFRDPPTRARLLKFHGCAVRARDDSGTYRGLLVGRQQQIEDWASDEAHRVMRQQMVSIATLQRTLLIGLSAQDTNIRDVFRDGKNTMPWDWPSHPPAYIFAEETVGEDQLAILASVYREAFDDDPAAIVAASQIRAFAKPLLVALVLDMLCRKLAALLRRAVARNLKSADHQILELGLRALRDRLASAADSDRTAYVRALVTETTKVLRMLRIGQTAGTGAYEPLGVHTVAQIPVDPSNSTSGLPEFAVALGILGLGETAGHWMLERTKSTAPVRGAVVVAQRGGSPNQRLFFVANQEAALRLHMSGAVGDKDPDAIVVYSTTPGPRPMRSPRARRRTGDPVTRRVGIGGLLEEAADITDLRRRFREEAVL